MDPAEFQRLFPGAATQQQPDDTALQEGAADLATVQPQDAPMEIPGTEMEVDPAAVQGMPELFDIREHIPGVSELKKATDAIGAGATRAVFETKDFLFGEPEEGEESALRQSVDARDAELKADSAAYAFMSGVSQFATAMLGVGKLGSTAKLIPGVGGLAAATTATKTARTVTEVGKAALAGAIAIDPHEERLSNLAQGTIFENPVTTWLAADKDDTAAEGRMKNALESIGTDAFIITTLLFAGKVHKALKRGDTGTASRYVSQFEAKTKEALANEQAAASPSAVRGETASPAPSPMGEAGGTGAPAPTTSAIPADPQVAAPEAQAAPSPDVQDGTQAARIDTDEVSVVANPTAAAAADGVSLSAQTAAQKPRIEFDVESSSGVLKGMQDDADAIAKHGGWYQAMQAGHKFGQGEGIPYVKLNTDREVDDFAARVIDAKVQEMDVAKGGAIMHDAKVQKMIAQRVAITKEDPSQLLGMIQQAGDGAAQMAANMEVSYLLANQAFQDAFKLGNRINGGLIPEFANVAAAEQEFAKRLSLAASFYSSAKSMSSNAGRALRRMRPEFKVDPSAFQGGDIKQMLDLVIATKGNPSALRTIAEPGIWKQMGDFLLYLRLNSLVSGPITQLVNVATSAYMAGVRPLERMLGGTALAVTGSSAGRSIIRENAKQYLYMGSAMYDGFQNAAKAFLRGDSVIHPHYTELGAGNRAAADMFGAGYKPWNSIGNTIHNAMYASTYAIGLPTRALGSVDELMKQTVYRSTVMARANMEAMEMAAQKGFTGRQAKDFVRTFVKQRVDDSFDSMGRGIDPAALQEANVATFQQELLPGTMGKGVQTFVNNWKPAKLVLPFVRTPTNVLRQGWKLTPGLNMLQTEYREMLRGSYGAAAKAQAMGQMSMGSLFLGSAAYLAANGMVTGGGPKDPKARAELMATGWKPYSFVWEDDDGNKTYVSFGRFDPVALPFGIIADLQDTMNVLDREDDPAVEAAIGGLAIALGKQFTSKSYLQGVSQTMDALMDPDRRMEAFSGGLATSFVPYSAAMRQLNPDDYMREARELADRVQANIPGYSDGLPPKRDWLGRPVLVRNGLWSSTEASDIDAEVQRLVAANGTILSAPSPKPNGVDLREVTLSNGENAYAEYQRLAGEGPGGGRTLAAAVNRMINSEGYQNAPDGDSGAKGTKLYRLQTLTRKYRERALNLLKRDPIIRDAFRADRLKIRDHYKALREGQEVPEETGLERLLSGFTSGD